MPAGAARGSIMAAMPLLSKLPIKLRRPALSAALIALVYAASGVLYIQLSGKIAASLARSLAELALLERLKGLVFIGVTAAILFLVAWLVLRRLEAERTRLARLEWGLVQEQSRHLPALLAASISHDLQNLLQIAILQMESPAGQSAPVAEIERSLRRLAEVGERMREIARGGSVTRAPQTFRVDALLTDIAELAATHNLMRVRGLERRVGSQVELTGDPTLLGLAVFNLLLNAAQASTSQPVRLVASREAGHLLIEVHDDGPGVPEALREKIFAPFFTQRAGGSGLGLVSVKSAAEAFGGSVEVGQSPLGGACFRLRLPL